MLHRTTLAGLATALALLLPGAALAGGHHHRHGGECTPLLTAATASSTYTLGTGIDVTGNLGCGGPLPGKTVTVLGFAGFGCEGHNNVSAAITDSAGDYSSGPWNTGPEAVLGDISFIALYNDTTSNCVDITVTEGTAGTTAVEAPNADAFCYGPAPASYAWITPAEFAFLTGPQPSWINGGEPYWTYGTVANATKGSDASGVMGNGFTPTCAKGTPTGQYVDNQGWWEVSGLPTFAGIVDPQGGLTVPEHYQVVTVP